LAQQRSRKTILVLAAPGEAVVREGGVGADEDVVFHHHSVPKLNAAFDCDAVANHHTAFDKCVVANVAVASDTGTRQDMGKRPHSRPFADLVSFDESVFVPEILHSTA
jgi:hypothetical protein